MTGRLVGEERDGCQDILRMMSLSNILSLHHTVTNKDNSTWITTSEAIRDILSYTNDAEELLKRRKVQRDLIFEYLHKEGVSMPQNIDKPQLVKQALEHWFLKKVRSYGRSSSTKPVVLNARSSESIPISPLPFNPEPYHPVQASAHPKDNDLRQSQTSDIVLTELTSDLAQQFCQWFYQLLNSLNPSLGQTAQDWGPQHFWEDVRLRLLSSAGNQYTEEIQGADQVSLRLLALARDEKLLLSPNLEPHGLRGLSSPHGLVLVAVAGTIHRDTDCVGIFEQVFGLICSPLDNKWKIKFMEVKMRGKDGLSMSSPSLTWDASELHRLCRQGLGH